MSLLALIAELLTAQVGQLVAFILTCYFVFNYFVKRPKKFPPGPTGIPFLGVALSVGKRPEVTFKKWAKKYGDIIGFKIGGSYTVVLDSYEAIQQALVKNAGVFSNRPNNVIFTEYLRKTGITASDYTDNFATDRKFIHRVLSKLGFGKREMEDHILENAGELVDSFGEGTVTFDEDAKRKLVFSISNVLAQVLFGDSFQSRQDPDYVTISSALHVFFQTGVPAFNALTLSPWLIYVPQVRRSAHVMDQSLKEYAATIRKIIKQHRESLDPSNPRDFIDEYLIERMKDESDDYYHTDAMFENIVIDLFGGGYETTAVTLQFSLLILANRPHIMKKIHAEIDAVIGSEGKPRFTQRHNMPYCHAYIKEVLRCRNPVPLLVPHAVHEDVDLNGYVIPKGTTVLANLHSVLSNSEYWTKPEEFNPDRFIDEEYKKEVNKYFIPFGMGPRMCIGRALGEMELFVFFVTLLQRFKIVPVPQPGCERPMVPDEIDHTGITSNLPIKTSINLIPRSL